MKKFILLFFVFMIVGLAFNARAEVKHKPVPEYYSDIPCITQVINEKAFRNVYYSSQESFVEYLVIGKTCEDTELLIWAEFDFTQCNSLPKIVVRFYFRNEEPEWQRVNTITIIDVAKAKEGEFPLFSLEDEFGKLFAEFYKKIGLEEGIKIPSINISKKKEE